MMEPPCQRPPSAAAERDEFGFDRETLDRLRALPLFAALDRHALATLLDGATSSHHARNDRLLSQGEEADRFYIVLSGRVCLHLVDSLERESIIDIVKPGDTFGEEAVFDRGRFSFGARVISDARLVRVPAATFLNALAADFRFVSCVMASMSAHLHCLVKQVGDLKLKTTEQRLASYLAGLAAETSGRVSIGLPYDKKIVASHLGMQPETLSRALGKLRDVGVRASHGIIHVDDIARLRAFCYRLDIPEERPRK